MPYVQTDHPQLARDLESRGLVMTDRAALLKARAERSAAKRLAVTSSHQQEFEERFAVMSHRLDRCETLLQELVQHITTLVARNTTPTVVEPQE